MPLPLTILIVDKGASIKPLTVKDYKVEDLFKKCGFKKADNFNLQTEWSIKLDGRKYVVQLYGKLEGKANTENKYDFPPPIDQQLFFGSCALVALSSDKLTHINLSVELWTKMYEKMFGGFDNLTLTSVEDEEEEDELENVPKHMKTKKGGYLKDGFVTSDAEEDVYETDDDDESDELKINEEDVDLEEELVLEELGSELSEEPYNYSDDENN